MLCWLSPEHPLRWLQKAFAGAPATDHHNFNMSLDKQARYLRQLHCPHCRLERHRIFRLPKIIGIVGVALTIKITIKR
jgi:hypothetical protein